MGEAHFTNGTLDGLKKGDWVDARYPNLIFRVGARTRTWLYRPPRRADGSRSGLKLGRYPDLPLQDAITKYTIERGRIAKGEPHPDLDQRIRELEAELRALKRAAGRLMTFGDLADRFVDEYAPKGRRSLTPRVRRRYARMLEVHTRPLWGDTDVDLIDDAEIEQLVLAIKKEGTPTVANALLKLLRTVFRWGIKKKIVSADPTANIDLPEKPRTRNRVLSPDELRVVWEAFARIETRHGQVLRFLILTGQRRIEATEAPWSEIQGDWWCLSEDRAKNRKPNLIFLAPLTQQILEEVRHDTGDSAYVFRGYLKKDGPVCKDQVSMRCKAVSDALVREGKITSRFTTHDLRRTFATRARAAGVDKPVMKQLLNHSSHSVTDIYDLYGMAPEIQAAMTTWDGYLTDLLGL